MLARTKRPQLGSRRLRACNPCGDTHRECGCEVAYLLQCGAHRPRDVQFQSLALPKEGAKNIRKGPIRKVDREKSTFLQFSRAEPGTTRRPGKDPGLQGLTAAPLPTWRRVRRRQLESLG